ncbi:uncharacterized protein BP5553_04044 [Venustampulla echinocandica]|uniref:Nudix hydrolase domain-containing protein n=1 Tax=Venustampulla echinocandica TaxID=2656787 RepID=A0A370TVZ6_9HELO|nr:uncharacterized protein BP5553_04044 [Venustampulla echinocandica]RDL39704.1 hypothetical protein BP5553_04044 [Venustampulla echinocandica]
MTETNLTLEEWLDDLCVRFIINLPEDDLKDIPRICFQVEEAQWFYEDFIRPLNPSLPSMSLRNFCLRIFAHCPLLSPFSQGHHMRAFEDFLAYKTRVPVRGAIMLNDNMDSVVLVKGWKKGASWSFPRGKIAKDEDDLTCAIREVYEETGFDLQAANLMPEDRDVKSIEVSMREQQMRLFVFRNVPMDTHFQPRTRKEISKIQWWRLSELPAFRKKGQQQPEAPSNSNPNKFYMVAPFLVPLRKWIIEQKKKDAKRTTSNQYLSAGMSHDEILTEEDQGAESIAQPSSYGKRPAPELDTLEGATAALSRLLKIQPPTEGLQPEATSQPSAAKNSGEALLALLHSKPTTSDQSTPINAPQHTPLEYATMQPPMPGRPHHPHTRPPNIPSMPPPPAFPVQNSFTYRDPSSQNGHHTGHIADFQPSRNGDSQNLPRAQENLRPYQPHLMHPQPLPPHVQRAVFTGGPVHSPAIPQPVQQHQPHVHPSSTVSVTVSNPQFPGLHAPMVPSSITQTPELPNTIAQAPPAPELTSHSLALLNAFKGRDQASSGSSVSKELPLRGYAEDPAAPRTHLQELPAGEAHRPLAAGPSTGMQPNTTVLSPGTLPPRQSISDSQRSALLGIFKSPTAQPASLSKSFAANALPTTGTPSAVELSAVEPLSTNAPTTSVLLNDKRTPDHVANIRNMTVPNPESNRAFRPMSILSRPQQVKNEEVQTKASSELTGQSVLNGPATSTNANGQATQSQGMPFKPQILKRPLPGPSGVPQFSSVISPSGPTSLPKTSPDRRPIQSTDQKQTLLSLFGKPQPTAHSPQPTAHSPQRQDGSSLGNPMELPAKAAARSRVGSLASGDGDISRRGSKDSISPADKGFLLSYLDAVASGSQR